MLGELEQLWLEPRRRLGEEDMVGLDDGNRTYPSFPFIIKDTDPRTFARKHILLVPYSIATTPCPIISFFRGINQPQYQNQSSAARPTTTPKRLVNRPTVTSRRDSNANGWNNCFSKQTLNPPFSGSFFSLPYDDFMTSRFPMPFMTHL